MEKDVGKIKKNPDTDIIVRVDDFGGRRGLTIREFVRSERYTGFTKAGTRIPADQFKDFKAAINSIDEKELMEAPVAPSEVQSSGMNMNRGQGTFEKKEFKKKEDVDFDEAAM